MGFAPTWLRQVSPPASQNHFNHWPNVQHVIVVTEAIQLENYVKIHPQLFQVNPG